MESSASLYMASPSPTQPNAPPNFFANGNGNGTTVPAAVFNSGQPASDDGGSDPKRRRIARACDQCRKKKIKCDGKLPACSHCVNYKTECVFTLVEKKRNPPKGAKYIEGLENRLGRMESLLKLSGLLPEGDEKTDLGDLERRLQESRDGSMRGTLGVGRTSSESARDTPTSSSMQSAENSPRTAREEEEVEALSDQMCSLVTNNCGETRFIGSSSGFSIFSPKGIQWVNEKTGDKSFQQMIMDASSERQGTKKNPMWNSDIFGELFDHRGTNAMPSKPTASMLVQDFFTGFNVLFPLFHKESFMVLFDRHYSNDPPINSGWYAAFNMVLAIGCRLRVSHTAEMPDDVAIARHIQTGWMYFQNAASVLTELLLRNTDLMSIQAILGMALFMQGTANPQPSYFLIAAAVRISTSIGMHRKGNSFGLSQLEVEQRRRIFWILYLLDKDIALRSGRPPCINDDDCNVELPDEDPPDGVGNVFLKNGKGKFNLFRTMMRFAVIESKVYMQLYSAKAGKQSDGELLNTIGELDKELEQWKDSVPPEFRPEHDIDVESQGILVLHVVVLHFAYYNCLTTIHRMSIHHGYWTSRLANYAIAGLSARPLNPRVFSSAALCVAAARASIHLIKHLNPRDYPCIWLIMYYPVSALVTIFANILQNPQDPRARSDLRLMHAVVEFLSTVLAADEYGGGKFEDGSVCRMLMVCGEFERIAKLVLDKSEKDNAARRKRKQQEDGPQSAVPRARNVRSSKSLGAPETPRNSMMSTPFSNPTSRMDVNSQLFNGANHLDQPFSPANSLSWLNDIGSPGQLGSPSSITESSGMPMVSSNSFEQPFVPQDLWQMPMTFEWDWADVSSQMPWEGASAPQM